MSETPRQDLPRPTCVSCGHEVADADRRVIDASCWSALQGELAALSNRHAPAGSNCAMGYHDQCSGSIHRHDFNGKCPCSCHDRKSNAHAALVEALRELVEATSDCDNPTDMGVGVTHTAYLNAGKVLAALALAEKP